VGKIDQAQAALVRTASGNACPGRTESARQKRVNYPVLGMEIQNAHRSLLPCSNCRGFALHDASWPSGIQGLRHVTALRRDIGPHHEKQPCREHGNPTGSPAKTKVQARQGQSQSLIGAVLLRRRSESARSGRNCPSPPLAASRQQQAHKFTPDGSQENDSQMADPSRYRTSSRRLERQAAPQARRRAYPPAARSVGASAA
jgi:hypothetical protein